MIVQLWGFTKTFESTKIPESPTYGHVDVEGNWKFGTSLLHPSIEFRANLLQTPYQFMYCRIASLFRYYFINNWTYIDGMWTADCSVDVMASFRESILDSTQYVTRAYYGNGGGLTDSLYPLSANVTDSFSVSPTNPFAYNYDDGMYVMGVIAQGEDAVAGCVKFYAMGPTFYKALSSTVFNVEPYYQGINVDEISEDLFKSIIDPGKYIQSVRWYPFKSFPNDAITPTNFHIGLWSWPITSGSEFNTSIRLLKTSYSQHVSYITLANHPQTDRFGKNANLPPFTVRKLHYPPFGDFLLDHPLLSDPLKIALVTDVDMTTGMAKLTIRYTKDFNFTADSPVMNTAQTSFAVDIPIRSSTYDLSGKGWDNAKTIGAVGLAQNTNDIIAYNTSELAARLLNNPDLIDQNAYNNMRGANFWGTVNIAMSSAVQTVVRGEVSSILAFRDNPYLETLFYAAAEENALSLGRPVCKNLRIADMNNGFIACQNPVVTNVLATSGEISAIRQMMANGFYKE